MTWWGIVEVAVFFWLSVWGECVVLRGMSAEVSVLVVWSIR